MLGGDGVDAWKSWLLFDDVIVALGDATSDVPSNGTYGTFSFVGLLGDSLPATPPRLADASTQGPPPKGQIGPRAQLARGTKCPKGPKGQGQTLGAKPDL